MNAYVVVLFGNITQYMPEQKAVTEDDSPIASPFQYYIYKSTFCLEIQNGCVYRDRYFIASITDAVSTFPLFLHFDIHKLLQAQSMDYKS